MKRWILLCFVIALVFLTCNSVQNAQAANLAENLGKLLPLIVDNQSIGLLFSQGLERQYGISNDPKDSERVKRVGNKILDAAGLKRENYDFAVLQSSDFNACSIYGGHIRVFKGLLTDTQNSDGELATAIAHEIAHNTLGHNKEAVKQFKITYALDLANISKKMPTLLLAGASAVLAKRSRQHETESDRQMLIWLPLAGYSQKGGIAMFRRIEAEHNLEQKRSGGNALTQRFNQIFSTHPEPATRVDAAEDYLFTQKYGRTFKEVLGANISRKLTTDVPILPKTGNCPIIVAHPGIWAKPLSNRSQITGVGFFNITSKLKEDEELKFYLETLGQGRLVSVLGDSDFHEFKGLTSDRSITFVGTDDLTESGLITAIRQGRTLASFLGLKIVRANFQIGASYPKIQKLRLKFGLALTENLFLAPEVQVFRNGQLVAKLKTNSSHLDRMPFYEFNDDRLPAGYYWYLLYIPGQLITSPITCEITNSPADPIDFPDKTNWPVGIIHCHSTYSDGYSTLRDIWQNAQEYNVKFVFMTDHQECFGENVNHLLKEIPIREFPHLHKNPNPYNDFANSCRDLSDLMIPGVEYTLSGGKNRHVLILGLKENHLENGMSEEEFFGSQSKDNNDQSQNYDKVLIDKGPFHLGDDEKDSEIHRDKTFDYTPQDAILKLRVKGTPRKDPVLFINRQEIARIVTSDDKWHWYEFPIKADQLYQGQNLFHIQAVIPDRWQTFDDCEVADVYILKQN